MQALLFAALLAFARAHQDDDAFFGAVAGTLFALLIFLRIDALLVLLGVAAATALSWLVDRRPPRLSFVVTLAAGGALGWFYLTGPLRAYFWLPLTYLRNLPLGPIVIAVAACAGLAAALVALRERVAARVRTLLPMAIAATLLALCGLRAVSAAAGRPARGGRRVRVPHVRRGLSLLARPCR